MHSFFSFEFYDHDTGHSVHEAYLEDIAGAELPDVIKQKLQKLGPNETEPVDRGSFRKCLEFGNEWRDLPIRIRHEYSCLSYRVHDGRELDLMLKGLKPLSMFPHMDPASTQWKFIQKYFPPLVKSRSFVGAELMLDGVDDFPFTPTVLYALPSESWRIDAYRLLESTAKVTKWNDALERIQGSLLGYTDVQNNDWMEYRQNKGYRWGVHATYAFMSGAELNQIRKSGRKAILPDAREFVRFYCPYGTHEIGDQIFGLAKTDPSNLVRLYIPLLILREFSQGMIKCENIEFEVFDVPTLRLCLLNEKIDGMIEIL